MTYATTVLGDSPTAYWRLGDASGTTAVDASPNGFNGTYVGGGIQLGQAGAIVDDTDTALRFTGAANTGVTLPPQVFNFGGFTQETFEVWFRVNPGNGGVILGQVGNAGIPPGSAAFSGWVPAIYLDTTGVVRSEMFWHGAVAPIQSGPGFNDGSWHHLVNVFNAGTETLFIDGVQRATGGPGLVEQPFAGGPANYSYFLGTGQTSSFPGGNGDWFYLNGALDEAAVYQNKALTLAQVQNHFQIGRANDVSFQLTAYTVAENAGTAQIAITRSGDLNRADSVRFSTLAGGTATSPVDYNAVLNQVVNFGIGQATANATVAIVDRPGIQPSRTVDLALIRNGATAAVVSPTDRAVLTINDTARPDLTATKTHIGNAVVGVPFTWKIQVTNSGGADATFADGDRILLDDLPSNVTDYNANVTNQNNVAGNFTCTFTPAVPATRLEVFAIGPVTIAPGGSFEVDVTFTPIEPGTLDNPTNPPTGVATVDPDNLLQEDDEGNNDFSDSVTISPGSQTITFTPPTSPVSFGVIPITLSATGGASGNPVVFSIDASSTGSGSISGNTLTVTSAGNIILNANQAGNANYNAAPQVQRTLVVNPTAPTAVVAGPTAAAEGTAVTFTGSFIHPAGAADAPFTYTWAVTASNGQNFALPPGTMGAPGAVPSFSFTPADEGTYTVTLTVSDGDNGSHTATRVLTVSNVAPVASIQQIAGILREGSRVYYRATSTDVGVNDAKTYSWRIFRGATLFTTGTGVTFSFIPNDSGIWRVELTTNDGDGGITRTNRTITVANANPTATFSNQGPVREGSPVAVVFGSRTDPSTVDGASLRYSYDFNNDGAWDVANSTTAFARYTFKEVGTYMVRGRISDKDGGFSTYTTSVRVTDAPLTAAGTTIRPTAGASFSGVVATFQDANVYTPATKFRATIAWGDGTSSSGTVIRLSAGRFSVRGVHTYRVAGSYAVTVSIADADGSRATARSTATVLDARLTATGRTLTANQYQRIAGTVASFVDANPRTTAADYRATIQWGDGTSTVGTVIADGRGGFLVQGEHLYRAAGLFSVRVRIVSAGGAITDVFSSIFVRRSMWLG